MTRATKAKHFSLQPIVLDARNFTSLSRTPWAGTMLAKGIKKGFVSQDNIPIGESWEVSCNSEAPSKLAMHPKVTLQNLIDACSREILSPQLIQAGRVTWDLLVKLLNASTPLSLQIHPDDDHPLLLPGECGKPESWLVLEAEPGSGLYLGFSRPMKVEDIQKHLLAGTFDYNWLNFVPVNKGDYFEISPGVPHAVGPGCVLLEPQRVLSSSQGKTWRMWDWNRKYNLAGLLDPEHGSPRELHISQSLSILKPDLQIGAKYVEGLRRKPVIQEPTEGVRVSIYPASPYHQVLYIEMTPGAVLTLNNTCSYAAISIVQGSLTTQKMDTASEEITTIMCGQSAVAPWGSLPLQITAGPDSCHWTGVIPAGVGVLPHNGYVIST